MKSFFQKAFSFLLYLLLCQYAMAQTAEEAKYERPAFDRGDLSVQIGLGYPNAAAVAVATYNYISQEAGIEGKGKSIPQINLALDWGLDRKISLGPYIGYSSATTPNINYNFPKIPAIPAIPFITEGREETPAQTGTFAIKASILSFGLRGVYHMQLSRKLDIYTRVLIGVNQNRISYEGDVPFEENLAKIEKVNVPEVDLGGQFGARFYATENLGFYGELGYGSNLLNIGFSYRFNKRDKSE